MRLKLKGVMYIMVISIIVLVFSACTSEKTNENDSSSDDSQEISFLAPQYSNKTKPMLEKVINDFESENPDIKIDLQVISFDQLNQQLKTMVATGQMPDIVGTSKYAELAADDLLMPLEEIMSNEFEEKFYGPLYENGGYEGKHYGIPYVASVRGLYYNKDLFEDAGISEPPKTWDELIDVSRKIKEETGIDGFGLPMTAFEGHAYASYFFWGNGGEWKKDGEWDLNSEANIEAVEFMDKLVKEYKVTNPEPTAIDREEMQKVFTAGQVGMMITASFFPALIEEEAPDLNYGLSSIPVNEGNPEFSLSAEDFIIVSKETQNKEAVSSFIEFLYDDERYETLVTEEGMLPSTKAVGESLSEKDPLLSELIEQLEVAKFFPIDDPRFAEARDETIKSVQEVFLGDKTAKEALDDLQKKLTDN